MQKAIHMFNLFKRKPQAASTVELTYIDKEKIMPVLKNIRNIVSDIEKSCKDVLLKNITDDNILDKLYEYKSVVMQLYNKLLLDIEKVQHPDAEANQYKLLEYRHKLNSVINDIYENYVKENNYAKKYDRNKILCKIFINKLYDSKVLRVERLYDNCFCVFLLPSYYFTIIDLGD
jgi:hypothetical protein